MHIDTFTLSKKRVREDRRAARLCYRPRRQSAAGHQARPARADAASENPVAEIVRIGTYVQTVIALADFESVQDAAAEGLIEKVEGAARSIVEIIRKTPAPALGERLN